MLGVKTKQNKNHRLKIQYKHQSQIQTWQRFWNYHPGN